MTLLGLNELLARARQGTDEFCGVYFLIYRREVVYVGSSVHVLHRVRTHQRSEKGFFTHWAFVECEEQSLDAVERAYILALRPRLNHVRIGSKTHLRYPTEGSQQRPTRWAA